MSEVEISELEALRQIRDLQKEQNELLKKALLSAKEQIVFLIEDNACLSKINKLQAAYIEELQPSPKKSHLRLVKNEDENKQDE